MNKKCNSGDELGIKENIIKGHNMYIFTCIIIQRVRGHVKFCLFAILVDCISVV